MTESTMPISGRVFISYRRQDAGTWANLLADWLTTRLGKAQVFMDVDSIEPGVDFAEVIVQAVGSCEVLLVIIGPRWLTTDDEGRRPLDDSDDIVRLEIETALRRDLRVIPVLVEGAQMPRRHDLPESLGSLARRNAIALRSESFSEDSNRLAATLGRVLDTPVASEPSAAELAPPMALPGEYQILHHGAEVNALAFSPDSRLLATGSADYAAAIWEAATGQRVITMKNMSQVGSVAFSPDGRLLATGSADNVISLWEATTGRRLIALKHSGTARSEQSASVDAVAFGPDGRLLASGSADGTARIWDAATGEERLQIAHRSSVFSVAFSPDGRWFASGSADGTARIWDAATGEERLHIAHRNAVLSVGFSPDGRWLATGSYDGAATIWETVTGRKHIKTTHGDRVTRVAFSPDGRWWATASYDDTARIFFFGEYDSR